MVMIKHIYSAGFFLLVLAAGAPGNAAEPVDLQRTLKGVEDRYNKIQTLQVKFTENYTAKGRTRAESGTLYLRKKGKMRWEYSAGMLFVSDGKFIFSYYPEEHRAEKMSMKETDDMRAPLAFLLGEVNFERDFGEYHYKPQDGGALITALPKSDKFPYTEVTFLIAPDSTIRRLEVKLQNNDLMAFTFEGEKKNPLLSDALFQFTPPKGVEFDDLTR
ncbi:MAG: outer rane lipoprotein carrier protein LolA [Bryobacterales bacterium]|nr:outer rane lipoprotein carrier protein LolA [Bryobacterales bacterium]